MYHNIILFIAAVPSSLHFLQRAAMLAFASVVLATAIPSVCLSVTRRYRQNDGT